MKIFETMNISGSGLSAERFRMDLIAGNLANINTTRTAEGGPYRRRTPVFAEKLEGARNNIGGRMNVRPEGMPGGGSARGNSKGVQVVGIHHDNTEPMLVHDPRHPDANEEGYVAMPNINVVNEMVNMITATRAYEANVTSVNASKDMFMKALEIGRG